MYMKKEGGAIFTSILYLSVIHLLFIYCFVVGSRIISADENLGITKIDDKYDLYGKVGAIIIITLISILNYLKYRNKERRDKIEKRFKDHRLTKTIKPWMILVFGLILFLFPVYFSPFIGLFQ